MVLSPNKKKLAIITDELFLKIFDIGTKKEESSIKISYINIKKLFWNE